VGGGKGEKHLNRGGASEIKYVQDTHYTAIWDSCRKRQGKRPHKKAEGSMAKKLGVMANTWD